MKQVLATWVFEPQISYVFCENKEMVLPNFVPTHAHMWNQSESS
jgi:hypothetical protein